jgi:hypothetical protein
MFLILKRKEPYEGKKNMIAIFLFALQIFQPLFSIAAPDMISINKMTMD